jgi:hypothetical protein
MTGGSLHDAPISQEKSPYASAQKKGTPTGGQEESPYASTGQGAKAAET